ncbi:hypothetical protein CVT25_015933 [Psilocybe cyanescens]|uniref:Uncharacterized protein n=1 Tax=Psilocybe cyanescens TaxID=93625 RepID=A0A409WSD8_PSICY|nr:hypothetical protein CVT25_015933 [Psilocybe cyanescens]
MTASPMSLSIASLPKPTAGSSQNLSLNEEPSQQQYGSPTPTFSPRRPERQPTTPSSRTPMTPSYAPTTPSRPGVGFTPAHGRTRSKTGPPESSVPNSPSPRRNTTLMTPSRGGSSASRIPVRMDSLKLNGSESKGKNAQLEKGKQKQNTEEGCEEDGEEGELRLLTPPPTPPFTARAFPASHALSLAGQMPAVSVLGEYCPSPYKSSYSAGVQQQPQTPSKPSGLGKGFTGGEGPRRPANPPVSALDLPSEFAGAGVKAGRSFPASSSSASSISDGSEPHCAGDAAAFDPSGLDGPSLSPAINRLQYLQKTHQQLSEALTTRMSPSTRPAFNARKASERCRAIEGYVSFASIEGLGEPPGAAFGDDSEGGAGAGGAGGSGTGNGGGVLGAAWGGWRRLLGVAGPPGVQAQAQEEGVVL